MDFSRFDAHLQSASLARPLNDTRRMTWARTRSATVIFSSLLVVGVAACAGGGDGGLDGDASPPGTPDGGGPKPPDGGGGGWPDGGVEPQDCTCPVEFSYPAAGVTSSVELRGNFAPGGWQSGAAMTLMGDHYAVTLQVAHGRPITYKFVVDGATWVTDPAAPFTVGDGFGGQNGALVADCGCAPLAFDWRDAVMYFVLLDRFADGDASNNAPLGGIETPANYQGGDLRGLRQKVDEGYFDDLGVNVIWISAPMDNADGKGVGDDGHDYSAYHGYWPRDLETVESRAGDEAELIALVDAAHRRGIRVVVDYVMNHVHIESPVYTQHPDWFWPLDKGGGAQCVCGDGCSWDPPEGLRCWFRSYLPDFNFQNAEARGYSVGNAIGWIMRTGIDGFRLDAIKHIETSWVTDLRGRVNAEIEFAGRVFYMVGETYTGDKGLIKSYVNPETMLDGQFDFPLRASAVRAILMRQGSMQDLEGFLAGNDGYYGPGALMGTFIGNHDLPRAIHLAEDQPLFGEWDGGKNRAWNNQPGQPGDRDAYERLAVGFALIMTLPGIPLIYYGDEIGLAGAGDPDNRRPMPWSGWSEHQTWLRGRIARLAKIRAMHPALRRGTRSGVGASADALVYKMSDGGETLYVALNRADGMTGAPSLPPGQYHDLVTDTDVSAPLTLAPRSAMILAPK
jgi:glycosidase